MNVAFFKKNLIYSNREVIIYIFIIINYKKE